MLPTPEESPRAAALRLRITEFSTQLHTEFSDLVASLGPGKFRRKVTSLVHASLEPGRPGRRRDPEISRAYELYRPRERLTPKVLIAAIADYDQLSPAERRRQRRRLAAAFRERRRAERRAQKPDRDLLAQSVAKKSKPVFFDPAAAGE
jgi:hypothetical protein